MPHASRLRRNAASDFTNAGVAALENAVLAKAAKAGNDLEG